MKMLYKYMGKKIGPYRCVSLPDGDDCLSGAKGEIWAKGDGTYKAFVALPSGSEKIIRFEYKDLHKWVSRLGVPPDTDQQAYWANNPNARHTG